MKPYRFRLEAVRRLREVKRDELRGELADAYLAAEKLQQESLRITEEARLAVDGQREVASQSTYDLNRLLESQRYEAFLKSQLTDLSQKAKLVEAEIARRQAAVVAAEQQVRVLDKLDEQGRQRHEVRARQAAQKELDEVATILRGAAGRA